MPKQDADNGWDVDNALRTLQAVLDPYIWEQGQELFRRGATEDFAVRSDGTIQVSVRDPRDARLFFVEVIRSDSGRIVVRCKCPYRLGEHCRHQVVALEYLKEISSGKSAAPTAAKTGDGAARGALSDGDGGSILYRMFPSATADGSVSTCADGSLLRVVLHSLGSSETSHRLSLQLYTGTGWTDLRSPDIERWIGRGNLGPHPRDAALAKRFVDDGELRGSFDSEQLGDLLGSLAGVDHAVLVDRMGKVLAVSPWSWRLGARIVRADRGGADRGGADDEVALKVEIQVLPPDHSFGEQDHRPFDEVLLVPSMRAWLQLDDGSFHPLVAGVPGPFLEKLQEEDLSSVSGEELDRLLAEGVSVLEKVCPGTFEVEDGIIREVEGVDGARIILEGDPTKLRGKLEFSYGGEWIVAPETPERWSIQRGEKILSFPPAGQSLARARRELSGIGFQRDEELWAISGPAALFRAIEPRARPFVRLVLPDRLETLDLVNDPPPERRPVLELTVRGAADGPAGDDGDAEGKGGAGAPMRVGGGWDFARPQGRNWFEVDFRLHAGDRELDVDPSSLLLAARDNDKAVQLDDGTVLGLDSDAVRQLIGLTAAADDGPGGTPLRVSLPVVTELLEEMPDVAVRFDDRVSDLVRSLRVDPTLAQVPLRAGLDELLRDYQKTAVRWFGALGSWQLGGILADEMGLGKTLMALTHLFGRAEEGGEGATKAAQPSLVVCPTSLIFNWLDECQRWFPGLRAEGLQGLPREQREAKIAGDADLLVTSYALLRRDREAFEARGLHAVILDEGQHIKNPDSQTAKAARALRSKERWILTGTPVENHLGELWSLVQFLMPNFLGEKAEFQREFADPIRKGDDDKLRTLRTRLSPFILRRTKEQVLPELPPRIEQVERAPMTDGQQQLYHQFLNQARAALDGGTDAKSRFKVLAALTRLRQICCHPRLVTDGENAPASPVMTADGKPDIGGKFTLLLELLEECIDEGHRVLLFSQFTSVLDLVEESIDEMGLRRCRLDGSTRDREGEVRRFQEDSGIPLFLISLKAGGFGLNLTQADTVILYDPWWNPAVEEQAAARAHRMGQTVPVHIHRLVTAGSIEEKILELQASKRELAAGILEEGGAEPTFDDLRSLLSG